MNTKSAIIMSAANPGVATAPQPTVQKESEDSWRAQDGNTFSSSLLKECHNSISELHKAMQHMDDAGVSLSGCLNRALENTRYKCVGDVLRSKLADVYSFTTSATSSALFSEMDDMLNSLHAHDDWRQDPQIYGQMLCHISLLLTKLKRQYFAVCFNKMADLIHSLLCLKGEEPAAGEVTKLVLKLGLADGLDSPVKSNSSLPSTPWGSPKTRKVRQEVARTQNRPGSFRIMSLFERKTSPPVESQSSFYVDIEDKSNTNGATDTQGRPLLDLMSGGDEDVIYDQPQYPSMEACEETGVSDIGNILLSGNTSGTIGDNLISFEPLSKNRTSSSFSVTVAPPSKLASEEELENVINLLSGMGCNASSPMQAIPEVPPQQGGPIQLIVPQIYRMPSPASDTHIDDFKPLNRPQPHRRSEGCLDLSSMWPSPHQLSPSPNLPWVQVFSASSHGSISECPSPISGYGRDSASPGYMTSPSPSYPSSPARVPMSGSNLTVGGAGVVRTSPLSPMQQQQHHHPTWGGSYSLGGVIGSPCPRSSSSDFPPRQQSTWPLHGATSFSSVPSGWTTGFQDGSDLSDDSSTDDQFFAVGKDLCHALDSKNGTTDEETEITGSGQAKNSSTWPLPNPNTISDTNRGLTPDLLEPPNTYPHHKPVQMQWSDPMSSRSMWPSGSLDVSQHKTSQSMQGFGGIQ